MCPAIQTKYAKEPKIIIWNFMDSEKIGLTKEKVDWINYRNRVRYLTELVKHEIMGIELRSFETTHIDHIISIWRGWRLGIEPEKIADIANLRMLSRYENAIKGAWN